MGAYHGKAGFDTFSHAKSVLRRPPHGEVPLVYPPYNELQEVGTAQGAVGAAVLEFGLHDRTDGAMGSGATRPDPAPGGPDWARHYELPPAGRSPSAGSSPCPAYPPARCTTTAGLGLLPEPEPSGPGASCTPRSHLQALQLIRELRDERAMGLGQIKASCPTSWTASTRLPRGADGLRRRTP